MKLLHAVTLAALLAGSAAQAETLTVSAQTQGWIASNGDSNGSSTWNMYTGIEFGHRYNSWAAFYIPPGEYNFASISFNPAIFGEYGANKIGIFDFSMPMQYLIDGTGPGVAAFQDLGGGKSYGSVTLGDQPKTANLSGNAVFDINAAAGSYIVFGFTNFTLNGMSADGEGGAIYLAGAGRGFVPLQLNLEVSPVPEPGSWAMLAGGLGLLGCVARRRRQQNA